ncbi:hypothetical protein NS334_08165 [Sphingomonas endophytica]|uniref:HTH crp-type domain-containing protein n=2 Tax=Sphingomonas endophytica TaxID=869719 RepID=A0A147I452_9SPHN|nr:hypothetical protein NS334_08165 [Sphingomonas endophytica]
MIGGGDPVRRRLERIAPGLAQAIAARQPRFATRSIGARREIAREGEMPTGVHALLGGWAAYARHFPDGRRQIQHVLVPGDLLALDRRTPFAATIIALSPVTLIDLDAPLLPEIALLDAASRRNALQTARHLLDAVARLGRQSAIERFAHLLLELRDRLLAVGMAGPTRFEMPLTQEMLADTLGLTSVHVNRTLQAMRQQGLVVLAGREVTLLRADLLAELADYASPARTPDAMEP